MAKNPRGLWLALVAALTLSALEASSAQAEKTYSATFEAGVLESETAKIDQEQVGNNTVKVGVQPPITCESWSFNGNGGVLGRIIAAIRLKFTSVKCHWVIFGITKPITITSASCEFIFKPSTTEVGGSKEYRASTEISCEGESKTKIHVYNNAAHTESLCVYEIGPQGPSQGITLTNQPGTPDDVLEHVKVGLSTVKSAGGELLCGPEKNTATWEGTNTLQATNAAGTQYVNFTVS